MRAAVCAASSSSSAPFFYTPTAKNKPFSAVFLSSLTPFPTLPLPSPLSASNSLAHRAYAAKKQPPADTASKKKSVGKRRTPDGHPAHVDSVGLAPAGPAQLRRDRPPPLPKPPAGFLLDQNGRVINVAAKRTATLVDPDSNLPLECVIRRVFQSSKGDECMLLYPVDTPIQLLKSANFSGWSAVNDEDIQSLIPAAAYALAKIHMHLILSGFCYTARGGFCYSEEDILQFGAYDDQSVEGLTAEGVEITCFNLDCAHYMIYTPSDPLLFVAVKDENGVLRIADDDLLEDPCTVAAIDEETEFNALVEEEAALLESLLEK